MLNVYFTSSNRSVLAEKELMEDMVSDSSADTGRSAVNRKCRSEERTLEVIRSAAGAAGSVPFQSRFFQ